MCMVYVDRHACLELTIPSVIGHSCVFTSVVVSKTETIACRIDLEDSWHIQPSGTIINETACTIAERSLYNLSHDWIKRLL